MISIKLLPILVISTLNASCSAASRFSLSSGSDLKQAVGKFLNRVPTGVCDTTLDETMDNRPMKVVLREKGKMVYYEKAKGRYLPKTPKKGTDEVMVSVRAAAINPIDYKGGYFMLGMIVGLDVAGVVTHVAEDSTSPFQVGDEVFGIAAGSLASRVCVSSSTLGRKPNSLSFVEAAAMPLTYLTSLQALREAKLREGARTLVIGASGGCGLAGLQLAQYLGASEIIGVSSAKNRDLVLREGATGHVDYATTNFAEQCDLGTTYDDQRFDVVYDCASGSGGGEEYKAAALTCLRKGGAGMHRGSHGQYVAINGATSMWLRHFTIGQRENEHLLVMKSSTKDLNLLAQLVDQGWNNFSGAHRLNPVVMQVIPLTSQYNLDEGFDILRSRRAVGKIVFDVGVTDESDLV